MTTSDVHARTPGAETSVGTSAETPTARTNVTPAITPTDAGEEAGIGPAHNRQPVQPRKRSYWLLAIPVLLAVLLGGLVWWMWPPTLHGVTLQEPRPSEDFTLQTSAGAPMSLSDFRGKYVMVYFGYTYCPDVCPVTLNDLAAMADTLGEERMEDVQVIFISVDPERDTPEHLARYLPNFSPNFLGMTGTIEEIQPVASQFGIFFESQGEAGESGYLVDHTSAVTLVDPQGRVRMVFPYGVTGPEMAGDLQYLMRSSFRF